MDGDLKLERNEVVVPENYWISQQNWHVDLQEVALGHLKTFWNTLRSGEILRYKSQILLDIDSDMKHF